MQFRLWDGEADARALAEKEEEVWAPVSWSPDRYRVSNLGRVASQTRGRPWLLMNVRAKANKYPVVGIYINKGDKRPRSALLHRLVLLAFDGEPPVGKPDGRHLNGNGHDSRLCNLAWGTRSENMMDLWKHRGKEVEPLLPPPKPNATYTLDPVAVQRGIKLFEKGAVQLEDLATLWSVSRGVARRALLGETWEHLERDMDQIKKHLGRTGEAHPRTTVSDADLKAALQLYTDEQWSGVRFAEFLGIKQVTAHSILSGRTRKSLPRPEGFQYPWPDAASRWARTGSSHHSAKLTEEQVVQLFLRIIEGEFETVSDLMKETGLKKSPVFNLLNGKTWKMVPRPEGFEEAVKKMKAAGNKARGQKNKKEQP